MSKVRQLSWHDCRLLVQGVLLLPLIHVALILLGYSHLRRMLERWTPLKPVDRPISEIGIVGRARQIARIVSVAAGHGFYKATCLRKSLLVWWFLRAEGMPGEICFGVRMFQRRLEAHAWVEVNGMVINDPANVYEQYHALHDALPATKRGL